MKYLPVYADLRYILHIFEAECAAEDWFRFIHYRRCDKYESLFRNDRTAKLYENRFVRENKSSTFLRGGSPFARRISSHDRDKIERRSRDRLLSNICRGQRDAISRRISIQTLEKNVWERRREGGNERALDKFIRDVTRRDAVHPDAQRRTLGS